MKLIEHSRRRAALLTLVALMAAGPAGVGYAQEASDEGRPSADDTIEPTAEEDYVGPIEEVVVIGRYKSAATDVVAERIEQDVPMDFLDAEAITRAGDSDVAQALRRMPGVTLAQGSFVYVRGLGERYSSTQLNGSRIPSPDITRNVLPLDIFPAAIIDSLEVAKGYSPDLPASFGGGNVDVRTKGIPEGPTVRFDIGSGWSSYHENGITYKGCDDDWKGESGGCRQQSPVLLEALDLFQGEFTSQNIKARLAGEGIDVTLNEAAQINRDLAKELNRFNDLESKDMPPDYDLSGTLGDRWYLGERWEFGAVAYGEYNRKWRNFDRTNRFVSLPETDYSNTKRTVDEVSITGSINGGFRFTDDHEVDALYLYIRNSEDDASFTTGCRQGQFNDCLDPNTPAQSAIYRYRYEERRLVARQLSGSHTLGDETLELLPSWLQWLDVARSLNFEWYYTDSETHTELPNEVTVNGVEGLVPGTFEVADYAIQPEGGALTYLYSELHDEVETWGGTFNFPVVWRDFDVELAAGYDRYKKGRSYDQYNYGLGSTFLAFDDIRFNTPENVFSDANLDNPEYGLQLLPGIGGIGTESYGAAEKVWADFFKADVLWRDTWRLSGGARWEEFQQVSVPFDLLAYSTPRIPLSADEIAESVTKEDDWYPSVFLTYIRPGFLAPEFQARVGWSRTVARPDLREVTPSTYIDPLTEARVRGNPDLTTSDLENYDVRLEWYWDNGDNLSVSGFYKDISDPIETVQGGATEDNILFGFVNADTAEIYGMEAEGLKGLGVFSGLLGDWTNWFYLQGNFTLSHSEVKIPPSGNVGNITNEERALTQQSDWVVNAQLGFDAPNGRHSANVVYNAYGPRIFFAGVDGFGDAKEQTFDSLDLNYSYYPTEELTIRLRFKNVLNDKIQIKQDGVKIIEQDVGVQYLLDFTWQL
jgi:outer membrane receptor protein involved in Fe transport